MNKTTKEQKALIRKKQNLKNRDNMFIARGKHEVLQQIFDSCSSSHRIFLVEGECSGQNRTESEKWNGMTLKEKTESLISLYNLK